jgi:hypothetical protein
MPGCVRRLEIPANAMQPDRRWGGSSGLRRCLQAVVRG